MPNEENIEQKPQEPVLTDKPKKFNTKVLIIGLPLFIVQLIVVYFVTANLLLSKIHNNNAATADSTHIETAGVPENGNSSNKIELGKYIFLIEDVIVNPADTEGKRLILTSVGFDLGEEKQMQEYKSKEVLLRDIIVSTISSKSLMQLSGVDFKDSIKTEIYSRVKNSLPDSKLNTVYISKYIIQ